MATSINDSTVMRISFVIPGYRIIIKTDVINNIRANQFGIYLTRAQKTISPIICHTLRAGLAIVKRSTTILFQSHLPINATIMTERNSAKRDATSSI